MESTADTLVSPCPACGKPRPVTDTAQVRCTACGATSPVDPKLVEAARTYRAARANAPLQLRQSGDIDALIARGNGYRRHFRIGAALLGAPILAAAVFGGHFASLWPADATRDQIVYAPALILPLVLALGMTVLVGLQLRSRNLAVQSLLWAHPMADAPGSFACRMCGGPLKPTTSKRAAVACPYCSSENLVGAEISKRAAKLALTDYATNAARVLGKLRFDERPWLAIVLMALPAIALVALPFVAHRIGAKLATKHGPLDPSISYVSTQCPSAALLTLSKASAPAAVVCSNELDVPLQRPFDPATLTTARVTPCSGWSSDFWPQSDTHYKVVDVWRDGFHRNLVTIDVGLGVQRPCLIDGMVLRVEPLLERR